MLDRRSLLALSGLVLAGVAVSGPASAQRRRAGQDRRDQQLLALSGVHPVLPAGLAARGRGGQCRRRRARRPAARGDLARRRRPDRQRRDARQRAGRGRGRGAARRHLPLQRRPRGLRLRQAEAGPVHRRRAALDRAHLGAGPTLHLAAAALDLHAEPHAGRRGGQAGCDPLGDHRAELRVRPVGGRRVQEAAAGAQARGRVRRGAVAGARQARGGADRAGAARGRARGDLQRHLRGRPRQVRARGHDARPVRGPRGGEPPDRRAGVSRSARRRGAGRLDRHGLSLAEDRHARAPGLPRGVPGQVRTSRRSSARWSATR